MSPSARQRGTAHCSLRISKWIVVTELGDNQNPAQTNGNGRSSRCASQARPKPRWQKTARHSRFGAGHR